MKKIIIFLLTLVLCFSFIGCVNSEDEEGENGAGLIKIAQFSGGFGSEWLKAIADDYKAITGITVKIVPSYTGGEIQSLLNSRQQKNDIVMSLLGIWGAQDAGLLEDLTSVYEAIPSGETVAIKDKMSVNIRDYMQADDEKWYQLNYVNSVSSLCYNKDTLDKFLGEDGWSVPNTTSELLAIANKLKAKSGVYAFTTSSQINYIWDYLGNIWWAQYEGVESYRKFFYGQYLDGTEWKTGPEINNAAGRKIALDTTAQFLDLSKGHMYNDARGMNFEEAQAVFVAQGFGRNKAEAAFMVNGDWFENEMQKYLTGKPQDIRMMRPPVVSDIINKLSTINNDTTLSAVISAIDKGETSYDGVSDADFARVKEARLMAYTATANHPIGIPSYRPEKQKKLAKDFLVYLCSEHAQKIYAKEMNGLTMPYGYQVDLTGTSEFTKSRITLFGNDMIPIFGDPGSPMVYRGGLSDMPGSSSNIDAMLIDGASSTSILKTSGDTMVLKWADYLSSLKQ